MSASIPVIGFNHSQISPPALLLMLLVCGGTAPFSGCIAYAENEAGDCDCDTIGNSGFLVDPYDPSQYFLCIPPEGQFFLSCPEGETFSTDENICMAPTTTTLSPDVSQEDSDIDCSTKGIGLHTNDPSCKTYTACYSPTLPGLLLTCDGAGEVFDTAQLRCVPQCELAPSPFTCPANSMGALPDTVDCKIFHVCSNGIAVTPSTGVPCPGDQVFEPMSMTCVAPTSDVVCPEFNECWPAYCDACGGTCPESIVTVGDSTSTTSTSTTTSTTSTPSTSTTTSTTSTTTTSTTTPTTTTTTSTTTPTTTTSTTTPTTTSTTTPTTTTVTTTPTKTTSTISPTTGPIECNNSPGYLADPADCKQFYSCQRNDAGVYEPVLYRCPGTLVYIPTKRYCSLQSDLAAAPECIAS
ncbi:unnamed protein product [Meganyctiphanes norvegica]|uniref:Chitin-binding type-2 domain-containing protein n=1 Tax=Meganyctiphanes norvegica TaxID=48144 RepID=A0AAV2R865_MEGNR